tara:strand:- start:39 stop:806 length:768 start_codon:yes stop_codon:yes gene_type:complete
MAAEKIGTIRARFLKKILDNSLKAGKISKKEYNQLRKEQGLDGLRIIQLDLFDPDKKKQGGLMEQVNGLKKMGMKKGGAMKEDPSKFKKRRRQLEGLKNTPGKKKKLSPQERKEMLDKINKSRGKLTNPFIKLDSMGRPMMEAKKGGLAEATAKLKAQGLKKGGFPDLSGDGKVTMKDVLMGRGVIKKPKKKKDGGSMTLEGGKLKGVKDAPEERRRERFIQRRKTLGGIGTLGAKGASKVAGRLAKRGYGAAKK